MRLTCGNVRLDDLSAGQGICGAEVAGSDDRVGLRVHVGTRMFDLAVAVVLLLLREIVVRRWAVGALWVWFRVCVRRAWCVRG
jgi:hypothetical protein